jgi:FKBP-type peptidyl-prolyl cis-trans isomerase FkpA
MKLRTYLLVALTLLAFSCKQKPYKTTAKGLKYKIYNSTGGEKAKLGDVIKFKYWIYTDKDSELSNSGGKGKVFMDRLFGARFGSFTEGFMMLAKGDSAAFFILADSMTKGQPDPKLKAGSLVRYVIKMLDIKSSAEFEKDQKKAIEEEQKLAEANKAKEPQLIEDYIKTKAPNAVKADSGVYYVIEKEGKGRKPKDGDSIVAHYAGSLIDGKEFDNDHGQPFTFKMGSHQVIPGWEIGFRQLKKGTKAKLIIPSKMAYGPRGYGKEIPPYSPLIFEVELVDVK